MEGGGERGREGGREGRREGGREGGGEEGGKGREREGEKMKGEREGRDNLLHVVCTGAHVATQQGNKLNYSDMW